MRFVLVATFVVLPANATCLVVGCGGDAGTRTGEAEA